jgi:Zn-dependent protease
MYGQDLFPDWSFSLGTVGGKPVRVSILLLAVGVIVCFQGLGVFHGLIFFAAFCLFLVIHELGHLLAARLTGAEMEGVVLWPLGGLSDFRYPLATAPQWIVPLGGPVANLLACAAFLPSVLHSESVGTALNPLNYPPVQNETDFAAVCLLSFHANAILVLINLLPILPLDLGRLVQTQLQLRLGGAAGTTGLLKLGIFVSLAMMGLGLAANHVWVVAIGGMLVALNLRGVLASRSSDVLDDSFLGYDFSEGYTSLERSERRLEPDREPGLLEAWLKERRAKRAEREAARAREIELRVDALLDKVHASGLGSLTDAERRLLKRASARYRDREGR